MEIKIYFNECHDNLKVILFPCSSNFLFSFFKDIEILNLEKIHIGLFGEDENNENDIYVNNDNYIEIMGTIDTINVISDYLQRYDFDTYLIYKLFFQIENISVLYDDDSLLELDIKMGNIDEMINYAQSIIKQYISTIVKW